MKKQKKLEMYQLPIVAESAENLVMGYLMRRNILTFKAPPKNEGYDLIAIHPDPKHIAKKAKFPLIRIQVKSRYATDCNKSFMVKEKSFKGFDYLIAVFLNIGKFGGKNNGSSGAKNIEFYTLPRKLIKKYHYKSGKWEKETLHPYLKELEKYKDEAGFELIAKALGVKKPQKTR